MKSAPLLVVISLLALLIACPQPAAAQTAAMLAGQFPRIEPPKKFPPHPRLFLNAKEIKDLRAWIVDDKKLYKHLDAFIGRMRQAAARPQLPDANRNRNIGIARQANELALAYALTGDAKLAKAAARILKGYVRIFPSYEVTNYKGKATDSTLAEVQWAAYACAAYDLIYDSGALTDADKTAIEEQVFRPSAEAMLACNHAHRSNWRIAGTSGAGVIGFCIGDRDLIDRALNGGRDGAGQLAYDGFVSQMGWSMLADGVYYERALGYTDICMLFYTWMLEAARHSNVDLWHAKFDGHELDLGCDYDGQFDRKGGKTFQNYFEAMCYRAFGDGSVAKVGNDGAGHLKRSHYWAAAWRAYRDPKYAWAFRNGLGGAVIGDPLELMFVSPEMPAGEFDLSKDTTIAQTGQHLNNCTLLPNGGFAILRDSAEQGAVAVAATYGDFANAHSHPDQLSMSLYAGGHVIAPDMKDYGYGHEGHLGWAKQTIAHNTVTVDEVSQYPQEAQADVWIGKNELRPAFGRAILFEPGKRLKAFRATTDTAYQGVKLDRTIVLVDSVVVDFFRCRSAAEHQYDLALHVDGKAAKADVDFKPLAGGKLSDQLGYQALAEVHRADLPAEPTALTYRSGKSGPTMRVTLLPAGPAELFAAMGYPNPDGHRRSALITRRKGTNVDFITVMSFDGAGDVRAVQPLTDLPEGLLGVRIDRKGRTDLIVSAEKPGTYTVAGQTFTGQVGLLVPGANKGVAPDKPEEPTGDDKADDVAEPPPTPKPDTPSDEDRAASLLQVAKTFHDRGMTKQAIGRLETCIKKYPDTEAAQEARVLLKKWR